MRRIKIMDDTERQEGMQQQAGDINEKAAEMQEKVVQSINTAMNSAAESLDATANKMHEASKFFRNKNVDTIKGDLSDFIRKYPGQTLAGALIFGFLFGKVLSR
jgi:TolA-binding protein